MTTTTPHHLSKSQYTRGLQCHKSLWLYRHRKDLQDPVDPGQQARFDQGTEFGRLATQRIGGGVLITADHAHPEEAVSETRKAILGGATVLYEAAFLHDDVLVRTDIISKDASGAWSLFEVKSSTKLEDVYMHDVAVQRHVMAGAGYRVERAYIVHANPGYVRRGALDLVGLFQIMDVTVASEAELERVPAALAAMKAVADGPAAPSVGIGAHCDKPYPCAFRGQCWAHVPEYSVFDIPYAKMEKKLDLFNRGVQFVHQVNPALAGLTDKRSIRAVEVARYGKPMVDLGTLKTFLAGLTYPIAHLDFETDNPVIPPYDGLRPYQQMPFQASVRVQQERGGAVVEHVFLGEGLTDPRSALISFLVGVVPTAGSVLAYYKPFEKGRLEELAQGEPNVVVAAGLMGMTRRLVDLADPFSKGWYTHPGFLGKWSIKNVVPVLVPSMTYANLVIKNGVEAMAAYAVLRDSVLPMGERRRIMDALKAYCGHDTLAMVEILGHLYACVAGSVDA